MVPRLRGLRFASVLPIAVNAILLFARGARGCFYGEGGGKIVLELGLVSGSTKTINMMINQFLMVQRCGATNPVTG